jgi:hypothetical protein
MAERRTRSNKRASSGNGGAAGDEVRRRRTAAREAEIEPTEALEPEFEDAPEVGDRAPAGG